MENVSLKLFFAPSDFFPNHDGLNDTPLSQESRGGALWALLVINMNRDSGIWVWIRYDLSVLKLALYKLIHQYPDQISIRF